MITQPIKAVDGIPSEQSQGQKPNTPQLYTVKQFPLVHPAFTASSLRNLIFKAGPRYSTKGEIPGNGLLECGAVLRLGRKILIDECAFFAWVRDKAAAGSEQIIGMSGAGIKRLPNGGK